MSLELPQSWGFILQEETVTRKTKRRLAVLGLIVALIAMILFCSYRHGLGSRPTAADQAGAMTSLNAASPLADPMGGDVPSPSDATGADTSPSPAAAIPDNAVQPYVSPMPSPLPAWPSDLTLGYCGAQVPGSTMAMLIRLQPDGSYRITRGVVANRHTTTTSKAFMSVSVVERPSGTTPKWGNTLTWDISKVLVRHVREVQFRTANDGSVSAMQRDVSNETDTMSTEAMGVVVCAS